MWLVVNFGNKEKLLYVPSKQSKLSSITNELIIIPSSYTPALLWQIHNTLEDPTKHQLKAYFDHSFFSVGLTAEIDKLYDN